ncbi:MAG TPA: RNA polymerase factor sigma-54 [Terriglobales bacterium]|nr:RNA polymerase factor sigma-54 [Terriglobales bacterium]
MVLLQHRLNVKLSQRQILTPGLVQMVSVLALNKLELKDMINAEMVENPVLEELEDAVPMLDEVGRQEEERERIAAKATTEENPITANEKKDPFEEIDFGSFFQEYLDPGYRSSSEMEEIEKPSFENFLSKSGNLTDHLLWQLGAISVRPPVHEAAEEIIGNLNEDGYLIASDDELMGVVPAAAPEADAQAQAKIVGQAEALGISSVAPEPAFAESTAPPSPAADPLTEVTPSAEPSASIHSYGNPASEFRMPAENDLVAQALAEPSFAEPSLTDISIADASRAHAPVATSAPAQHVPYSPELPAPSSNGSTTTPSASTTATNSAPSGNGATASHAAAAAPARSAVGFTLADLHEALEVVRQLDPPGVACRDLRECLLRQLDYHKQQLLQGRNGATEQVLADAIAVVDQHLHAVTLKQFKEIGKAIGRPVEAVQAALDYVRTLDPRPGLQYNKTPARLIEPDVAFVKHGDEWLIIMNDEDMPQLRLNPAYKRLLTRDGNDKDTRNYVKDRYKSAIQLIKNIEQRKQTITKVCYSIVARQQDFLERGIDHLKPMMIKEVAEEIGVHPSTVSRAVANKYVHTPQGVFELRYFFSESVQGPEGGGTSLLILKRRVKKLIEEEDPTRPLTDEQITRILQSQGIDVTRRTVAKYREDMKIPSTHQRRVKK